MSFLLAYLEVTKPRIWLLLVFTALGGFLVASENIIPFATGATVLTAVALGSAGSNTLTNYIDRDIDAVMDRTKLRPLPTKRLTPASRALHFGLFLSAGSLILSSFINPICLVLMLLGIFDNVVIYSRLLKRRSPLNIILGGFSGGAPVLIGYAAVTNGVSTVALLMALLVIIWIPTHIWSLALHSKDDYSRVNVPMLPVIVSDKTAIRVISASSILMVVFSLSPPLLSSFGAIYLYSAVILGVLMLVLNLWLFIKPSKEVSWIVFKASSPYLGLLFLGFMLDVLLS